MDTEIWLFYPENERDSVERLRFALKESCENLGWKLVQRQTKDCRAPSGRKLLMVQTEDAANLYKRMHRARVGVFLAREAYVRADPSEEPNVGPGSIPLEQYVRYKAFLVAGNAAHLTQNCSQSLDEIRAWCNMCLCEGENDPRCLPLHVFDTKDARTELGTAEGRARFDADFGKGGKRRDARGLAWDRAKALHGGDTLHVAGRFLVQGFHWDVTGDRGGEFRLCTANEVWKVQQRGYLNVYPDAYVRQGDYAKRVYPKK